MGAKDSFFVDILVFVPDDGTNSARNNTRCGMCMRQPTFGREVRNFDRRGGLGGARDGLGHDGRRDRSLGVSDSHGGEC